MKTLHKSADDRIMAGVVGGFAQYFNVDSTLLRIVFVGLLLMTGLVPGAILYVIAAILMPSNAH